MGTLLNAILQNANTIQSLKERVDLLLAAYGEGQIDPEEIQTQIKNATQDAIDSVLNQLDGLDVTNLSNRIDLHKEILSLKNKYGDDKFSFELFNEYFTLADTFEVNVLSGVQGDDSLDVESTTDLEVGKEYQIEGGLQREVVVIKEILSENRVRLKNVLENNYDNTAKLRRTNWTFSNNKSAALAGQVYYSVPVDLGASSEKTVVIRVDKDSPLKMYSEDGETWQEIPWCWKREVDGWFDFEYWLDNLNAEIKLVAQDDVSIDFMAFLNKHTSLDGSHHAPEQPQNVSPADGAVDIGETPTLEATTYQHVLGTAQAALQIQIATDVNFENIVHDSGEQSSGNSYTVPKGILETNTTYFWRARYKDAEDAWSVWSSATSFTTAESFIYISTPTNMSPVDGATNINETPTFVSSDFNVVNGSDTHVASQWQIRTAGGTYESPLHDSGEDATNLTSYVVPSGILQDGQQIYFWRVRHKGETLGWSEWSAETSFTTKEQFAEIVGIALVSSGGGAGSWQRVDADGNNISPSQTYFDNHPIYSQIQDVTVDGQTMVKIPKFYYKVGSAPDGSDQAGKKCWWISDTPVEGFRLHPAFMDEGVEIDYFLVGKYECVDDPNASGTKAASLAGRAPLVSIDFSTMQSRCEARNTGGVEGFHLWNIYELAAIQMLCLIEVGTPDVQSAIGSGNVNSSAAQNTGSTNAVWRGIYELWGNVWHMVDGLQVDGSHQVQVFDLNGDNTLISTGVTTISTDGWITSMHEDSADNFDLRAIFLPNAIDGTESNGTFGDYLWASDVDEQNVCYHGGHWSDGSRAGLFSLHLNVVATNSNTNRGGRLAKK